MNYDGKQKRRKHVIIINRVQLILLYQFKVNKHKIQQLLPIIFCHIHTEQPANRSMNSEPV